MGILLLLVIVLALAFAPIYALYRWGPGEIAPSAASNASFQSNAAGTQLVWGASSTGSLPINYTWLVTDPTGTTRVDTGTTPLTSTFVQGTAGGSSYLVRIVASNPYGNSQPYQVLLSTPP